MIDRLFDFLELQPPELVLLCFLAACGSFVWVSTIAITEALELLERIKKFELKNPGVVVVRSQETGCNKCGARCLHCDSRPPIRKPQCDAIINI